MSGDAAQAMADGRPRADTVLRDSALLGAVALLGFLVLQQRTLYAIDSQWFLMSVLEGDLMHPFHYAYLPWLAAWWHALAPFGVSVHGAGVVASAVGAAFGVATMHAAARRCGHDRRTAAWFAVVAAVAPGLVFYASVVELHGPHFGACSLAFLATATLARQPGVRAGIWLGLATGCGFAGHATGALLPAVVFPSALALAVERGHSWRLCVRPLLAAAVVHGTIVLGLPKLLAACGYPVGVSSTAGFFGHYAAQFAGRPWAVPMALWHEWLLPFLPWSLVALAALRQPAARPFVVALALSSAVYVLVAAVLSADRNEGGAYLLPLLWPFATIAVRVLGSRGLALGALLGIAVAVVQVRVHDTHPSDAFTAGFRAAIGDRRAFVVVGDTVEMASFFLDLDERAPIRDWIAPLRVGQFVRDQRAAAGAMLVVGWQQLVAQGVEVWVTAPGRRMLHDNDLAANGPGGTLLAQLDAAFEWMPAAAPGFDAFRLVPRR